MPISGLLTALFGVLLAGRIGAAPEAGKGFFRVVREKGIYWLIDPAGRRFYSMGINCVVPGDWSPKEESPRYRGAEIRGGEEKWASFTANRMREWGFNTVAGWSHRRMEKQGVPYCVSLHLAPWDNGRLLDVWDEGYAKHVAEEAVKQIGDRKPGDSDLIGYFLDNELPWMGKAGWYTDGTTLLDLYLALPGDAAGRRQADRVIAANGRDRGRAAEEFSGEVARRFMSLTAGAVRKLDPNHLILGVRMANWAPDAVVRGVGEYTDVFTLNWYVKNGRPDPAELDRYYLLSGKPVMITEFSYRAMENRSGLRNTRGADVTVPTQEERARRYTRYVETLAVLPQVIGFHWFQWADQPTLGRFDGEDSNYGLVDQKDEPYVPLLTAMRRINGMVARLHAESPFKLPEKLGERRSRPAIPVAGAESGRLFSGLMFTDHAGKGNPPAAWGDEEAGCGGTAAIRDRVAILSFRACKGWGSGMTLANSGGPADAGGATRLKMTVKATKGIRYRIILTEDGAGPPESASFAGVRGADGEQYTTGERTGTGDLEEVDQALSALEPVSWYGNQGGNGILDARAIRGVEISVPGGQGAGEIAVGPVRFE